MKSDRQILDSEYNEILLRAVALLPWSSNLLLMSKDLTDEQTLFYAQETIRKVWWHVNLHWIVMLRSMM